MALNRKYANLPDLDSAPDIYETPELTDDNSTAPTTAPQTHSEDDLDDLDDETPGISRSRLQINQARSRFQPSLVDAGGADFSDRVDGKRKSYKAASRRQRRLEDGTIEYAELSDEEDEDEGLERKIARLKREVGEAQAQLLKQNASSAEQGDGQDISNAELETLTQALEEMSRPQGLSQVEPTKRPEEAVPEQHQVESSTNRATYSITYAPTYEESHSLAKVADFDRRLLFLENGLGIATLMSDAGDTGLTRAVLPVLDSMDRQITMLSQASTTNLDAISRRVRALAQEQDRLNSSREKAKTLREEMGKHTGTTPASEDSDQDAKIQALYGILPTIENLAPILPPLLDRLRSLREIHTKAATASQVLERIEEQQAKMAGELKQWSEGLEKMEEAVKGGGTSMQGNVEVMEGWVKELEDRMEKL